MTPRHRKWKGPAPKSLLLIFHRCSPHGDKGCRARQRLIVSAQYYGPAQPRGGIFRPATFLRFLSLCLQRRDERISCAVCLCAASTWCLKMLNLQGNKHAIYIRGVKPSFSRSFTGLMLRFCSAGGWQLHFSHFKQMARSNFIYDLQINPVTSCATNFCAKKLDD